MNTRFATPRLVGTVGLLVLAGSLAGCYYPYGYYPGGYYSPGYATYYPTVPAASTQQAVPTPPPPSASTKSVSPPPVTTPDEQYEAPTYAVAQPPVYVAPPYPAYPAYYPGYYPAYPAWGGPAWWGPSISLGFGWGGRGWRGGGRGWHH